jgi:hypothetical protein
VEDDALETEAMAVDVMEVDALIADSVVTADGKLYVQGGGWDTIGSATFPFRQPRIGVGVLLRIPWTRTNEMHTLGLRIVDQDENKIVLGDAPPGADTPDGKVREIKGQFNLGRPPFLSVGDSQIVPIAMNLDGIEFNQPDTYSAVIAIDGKDKRRLTIRVRPIHMSGMGFTQPPRLSA